MKLENLEKLYLDELKDIYDAEHQILKALPKMAKKAAARDLQRAFEDHQKQTEGQVQRLEKVFDRLGKKATRKTCKGVKGLIEEGEEYVKATGDEDTIDASLISAAQRVEHYEMAAYGTLRTYAEILGHDEQARLLQQTLDEEEKTDQRLTKLAQSGINVQAAAARGH